MILTPQTPRQALSKALLKVKPERSEIDRFKANLIELLDHANDNESEEFHKKLVSDFLGRTYYYPNHYINTKGSADLVVHNGPDATSTVGIIIEAKKPTNKAQMVTKTNLNTKAFQELLLYYLRERLAGSNHNLEVRHLVITNAYEWYVFDSTIFEKYFAQNSSLVKQFRDFEAGRLSGKTTDFFYKEIAAPAISALDIEVKFLYFDVREYETALRNSDLGDDAPLVGLYKSLSPAHLLKLPFANDSNSLHRGFYTELLHIIGLAEQRDGAKRLIGRLDTAKRNSGSLLENTISQLETLDKVRRISNVAKYGADKEERTFNVALELVITWINRVLFLKLLEAQLLAYHRPKDKTFLNVSSIPDFDALNSLFFEILAKRPSERHNETLNHIAWIPYLNSSLFEVTELEQQSIVVSNLQDGRRLPVFAGTVLKDARGLKAVGDMAALDYLFQFLDAYDFGADSDSEIREDNRSLISASVLGLIFEKINGYKDGSFFTPGFVTMNLCRSVVRNAVISRFNQVKGWNCLTIDDVYEQIKDRSDANRVINSVRLCDPAVGSGHFLVSALNEFIAIKAELRVLTDLDGNRLKEYDIEIASDELVIADDAGEFFRYRPRNKESQRVQKALFHEKQTIIENCLFGVDINPNSVHICRLRLWIELLKNAYYREDGELETLPNIDINIKHGDSLVSRFALDADLGKALKKRKLKVSDYRDAVRTYQNASSKDQRQKMQELIDQLKGEFQIEIHESSPKVRRLRSAEADLEKSKNQQLLFALSASEKREKIALEKRLTAEVSKLRSAVDAIRNNRMFQDAFEWRFEFPEVLADSGAFLGFDAIIGNPPYGVPVTGLERSHLVADLGKVPDFEIYYWFLNRAFQVLRPGGVLGFIVPNTILFNVGAAAYRLQLLEQWKADEILDCTDFQIFDDAVVRNVLLTLTKSTGGTSIGYRNTQGATSFSQLVSRPLLHVPKEVAAENNENWGLLFKLDEKVLELVRKLRKLSTVDEYFSATQGYIPYRRSDLEKKYGLKEAKEIVEKRLWHSDHKASDEHLEEIYGKSLSRYAYSRTGSFVRYGDHLACYVDMKYFNQRRLLVREITNPTIVATIVDEVFVNDPQIIAVIPRGDTYSVDFLWAIFNSKLARFFHFNGSPKATKGHFPKILVRDVKQFPIPYVKKPVLRRVEQLTRKAFAVYDAGKHLGEVEQQLDQLVYEMYGLNQDEIALIEACS